MFRIRSLRAGRVCVPPGASVAMMLAMLATGARAGSELCVLGPAPVAPRQEDPAEATLHCTCPSDIQFFMNSDRQYEVAFAWPGAPSELAEVGAFAERYETPEGRAGAVCQIVLATTDDGRAIPATADLFVWSNENDGPGVVLGMLTDVDLGTVAPWPTVGTRLIEVYEILVIGVQGAFWTGARISGQDEGCSVYVGGDVDGEMPDIVRDGRTLPLAGESTTEWTDFGSFWERPVALGIGVIVGWCPVPIQEGTWGSIKVLYR